MMNIPCFYFPTTVMLVDDNRSILDNLSLSLDPKLAFKLYDQPENALLALQSQLAAPAFNREFIQKNSADSDDEDNISIKINFESIRKLIHNSQRFSHVTALIIDYSMPKLTGLEFCQRLHGSPLTKIMLTGEAGPTVAIDAFNDGVIDQFIVKATPNMQSHLNDSIQAAQWDFFVKQSEHVMAVLKTQSECALFEPAYQKLIKTLFLESQPCEFYLLDQTGSFLFIDEFGDCKWIVVRNERELNDYYEIAKDYSKAYSMPDNLLNDLKEYNKIPFLFSEKQRTLQVSEWVEYLYPADLIEGRSNYYYAIIEGRKDYLSNLPLQSYTNYLVMT